ncbi:8681_t:CDS:2 [Ambispora leptoticha]|uniref:15-cis-phytoene synthase n=1 Tax=Ambispora leptoticha TaxID=144679 RepID=A0A9N8VGX1_9GLOM|nr:8681_t:CDS:2 [Ambispora leptoticha]
MLNSVSTISLLLFWADLWLMLCSLYTIVESCFEVKDIESYLESRLEVESKENPTKVKDIESYLESRLPTKTRKHDYENYLCSALYPKNLQYAYYAIRAFNVELAMVRGSVSSQLIGKMRMQFWRESIDSIFKGNPPHHPVALLLNSTLEHCKLSSLFFKRIINERDANLDDPPYMSIRDLESYGENTASCLLYLQLELLGIKNIQADHAASHIGKATGIVTILRAFPYLASKRRMYLPADTLAKFKISEEAIFREGPTVKGLEDAVFEVATTAHDHLLTARSFLPEIQREAMPVFLSSIACDSYLKRLEKYNFNVFEPKLSVRDWKLPFLIWWNYRSNKF